MVDAGGQMGAKPAICAAGEAPIGDFRDCICNLYCRAIGALARCPNLTPALRELCPSQSCDLSALWHRSCAKLAYKFRAFVLGYRDTAGGDLMLDGSFGTTD